MPRSSLITVVAAILNVAGQLPLTLSSMCDQTVDGIERLAWRYRNMSDTVHPAFVASTVVVLGINIVFAAFLFNIIREEPQ